MARSLRLAVAALSVAVLSTTASSALADAAFGEATAPYRGCQVALGMTGLSLPSNAPALLVGDRSSGATATVSADLVSTGERLPFGAPTKDAHGLLVVAIPEAASGEHGLAVNVACSDKSPAKVQTTTLALTAPVAFPTTVGTLTVRPNATPTGVASLDLVASPELRAFAPASVIELTVDGQVVPVSSADGLDGEIRVSTGSVCVENGALHREMRTVRVSLAAHIAGVAESPAPAVVDVAVDCGAIRWTSDADFDGSDDSSNQSSGSLGSSGGNGNGNGTSTASGCSAAPRGQLPGRSIAFAAATALSLVVAARRRRAR